MTALKHKGKWHCNYDIIDEYLDVAHILQMSHLQKGNNVPVSFL